MPEWQVFIRRADGSSHRFTISHKLQLRTATALAVLGLWSVISAYALSERPAELADKARELEQATTAYRTAQHRLNAAEKMVAEIAHEVDEVHANVVALAASSGSLAHDRPAQGRPIRQARALMEPAYDESGQIGAPEAKAVREQVRRLEDSLDRLRLASTQAAQQAADLAGTRISETERQLARLGIDAGQVLKRQPGQGGPFIPVRADAAPEPAVGNLMNRVQHWNGMQAAMLRLPLAEPLHGAYEFNSGFGTRNDPLNHRTGVHEGIDLGAPIGTPVYATAEGVVAFAEAWDRYGNTVEIDHGNGLSTRYAHLSRLNVKEGQKVTRATVIGLVGNTGRSTGAHLHYEVRVSDNPRDPLKFIAAGRNVSKIR